LRRTTLLAGLTAVTAALALPLTATPASADPVERRCYTPYVAGFDTYEVCYFLPVVELEP
jgi:hypothetical protein